MKNECFICMNLKVDFLLEKDGYNLWHCNNCELNFIYPQPTERELQKIYSLEVGYSHSNKGFDKKRITIDKDYRIDFLVENNKKKILDVGCASGAFVYAAKSEGLNPTGIDLDKDSIKFGIKEELDLRHGKLEDFNFEKQSFDAINLGDIIEHVKNPENFLKECVRILKKEGILIISTPNTNSLFPRVTRWAYQKLGIMWSHTTPPYHLFDFSDNNLKILLIKNDLEIKKITYSKISLAYSIYHTGYFNDLRKKIIGYSSKDIARGLLKSISLKIFKQAIVAFIYGAVFCIDRAFEKKGDRMTIFAIKKRDTFAQ